MQAGNLRGVGRPSNVAIAATRPKVQHKIRSCACETSLSIASYFRVMPAASYIKRPVFDPAVPRLFIIDDSKALAWAIRRSFGRNTAIQRCQIHKAPNIMERLPKPPHTSVRRALRQAWELNDAA
jgi:hypothetical protein